MRNTQRLIQLVLAQDATAADALERDARRHDDRAALVLSLAASTRPNAARWDELCSLVAQGVGDLDTLEALLDAHWPARLRVLPRTWSVALLEGTPVPAVRLVRWLRGDAAMLTRILGVVSPALVGVETHGSDDGADGDMLVSSLVGKHRFAALTDLRLNCTQLTAGGLTSLLESPLATQLTHLGMCCTGLSDEMAMQLARAERMHQLRGLGFCWFTRLSLEAWDTLLTAPHLQTLESLSMGAWPLEERETNTRRILRVLERATGLNGLRRLALEVVQGPRGALLTLLRAPHLGQLDDLTVKSFGNDFDPTDEFSEATSHLRLERLCLKNVLGAMNVTGVKRLRYADLFGAKHFESLRELGLWWWQLGDDGASELAALPTLQRLRCLSLRCVGLQDAGAMALADASRLPRLERLALPHNQIGTRGALALRARLGCSPLRELDLEENPCVSGEAETSPADA